MKTCAMETMGWAAAAIAALALAGCSGEDAGQLGRGYGSQDPNAPPTGGGGPTQPGDKDPTGSVCREGKSYLGFAASQLNADRVDGKPGDDRRRVKPYSALQSEYPRVLGTTPASLAGAAATFVDPPRRWFIEPQSSAVSLYTSYAIAFEGCLDAMNDASHAAAPTAQTATSECARMQRKFWSRTGSQEEVDACVKLATVDLASEPDARRRWAYTCASILTATGFVTY